MTKDGTHRKTESYIVVHFHPVGAEEGHGANARRKIRRGKKKKKEKRKKKGGGGGKKKTYCFLRF